jgi:AmiR/NasT family two-component response regulator
MHKGDKVRAVVAEDEYLVSLEVVHAVEAAGFEVVGVAPNGEKALELIRRHRPDVAILDIRMPVLDGLEAAVRIRDEMPLPVVVMTAYETPEILERAKAAGVGAYLVKPPDPSGIRRAVELAVARHDDLMELQRVNAELRDAMARIRTLEGILTICASCKKIRDEKGNWVPVEEYIDDRTGASFSHGVCPDCGKRLYPQVPWGDPNPE